MPTTKLEEIIAIKNRWEKQWISHPSVTGVDVGSRMLGGRPTDVLAIRVYVADRSSAPAELLALKEIEGVPVDIIQRSFELH